MLTTVDSKIEQELYIDKISKEYQISKEALYAEINKLNNNKTGNKILEKNVRVVTKQQNVDVPKTLQKREDAIVALLLKGDEEIFKQIKERISSDDLRTEVNRRIVENVYNEYKKTNETVNNFLELFSEDQEAINKITEIMAEDEENSVDKKTLDNLLNVYEKEKLTIIKTEIIHKLNEAHDKMEMQKLEEELNKIIIKLAKFK